MTGQQRLELGHVERSESTGGQLQPQGQAVESSAERGDRGGVGVVDDEVRSNRPGPFDQEAHRRAGGDGRGVIGDRTVEGTEGVGRLDGQPEPPPAGDQQLEAGSGLHQGRDGDPEALDHEVGVVDHQQQAPVGQRQSQTPLDVGSLGRPDPDGIGHRNHHSVRLHPDQVDQADLAIGSAGQLAGQAALPHPGRTDQGDQTVTSQAACDLGQVVVAADQGRIRSGHCGLAGPGRRHLDQLGPAGGPELAPEGGDVALDRADRDVELLGQFGVGQPTPDRVEDLRLPTGQHLGDRIALAGGHGEDHPTGHAGRSP